MTEEKSEKLLQFVCGDPVYNSEENASALLESIEDAFIYKFLSMNSFKYLGLRLDDSGIFYLELAYYKINEWREEVDKMLSFIREKLKDDLVVFAINKAMNVDVVIEAIEKLHINTIESNLKFDFHNTENTCDEIFNFIGDRICIKDESPGALGAIITIKNDSNLYLLTNHHVIIKTNKKLKDCVYSRGICIGETFWGLNNNKYDVALAKLTLSCHENIPRNKFNNTKPPITGGVVSKFGPMGPGSGTIYSSKALVKIRNKIYKNQILMEGLHLVGGESGTIVTYKNTNDVVGLHIGGDSKLDISNNIYELFRNKIKSYQDSETRIHPAITFQSFY